MANVVWNLPYFVYIEELNSLTYEKYNTLKNYIYYWSIMKKTDFFSVYFMSHVRCASDGSKWIYAEIVELVITWCRLWHLSGSLCEMSAQSVGRRRQMRNKYHWAVIWTCVDGRCQLRRTVSTSVHILIVTHRTPWPNYGSQRIVRW